MAFLSILWDLPYDPEGNLAHIVEHGVTQEEVDEVFRNPAGIEASRSSGRPIIFGECSTGRIIAVVYEEIDADTIYPVTAFEVEL